MLQRLHLILVATAGLLCTFPVGAGEISGHSFFSNALQRDYAYNVYLPDEYDALWGNLPTLYALHCSGCNQNEWVNRGGIGRIADRLIRDNTIPPVVIVMPGSKSWWVDGYNEPAEKAFIEDLIPHIENTFGVRRDEREFRFVVGNSAGGYGTVNFVLEYPTMFAAGAALSPASYVPQPPPNSSAYDHPTFLDENGTYDPDKWLELNYPNHIDEYKVNGPVVPLYITAGTGDAFDIDYHAELLHHALEGHQTDHIKLCITEGGHNWKFWKEKLPEALAYLFAYNIEQGIPCKEPGSGRGRPGR